MSFLTRTLLGIVTAPGLTRNFKPQRGQRRQCDPGGILLTVQWRFFSGYGTRHSNTTASIDAQVSVDNQPVMPGFRQSQSMALSHNGRKVADTDQLLSRVPRPANERNDIVGRVVSIYPLKSRGLAIHLPERILRRINAIEIANQALHTMMNWLFKQMPVETLAVVPFAPLPKLASHEEQLL